MFVYSLIDFISDTPDVVTDWIKSELGPDGFECWETSIGGSGVQVDVHSSG